MFTVDPSDLSKISTHALREEGDRSDPPFCFCFHKFLPTPSARRATLVKPAVGAPFAISTHALREEGDHTAASAASSCHYFYPRPPRGGRLRSRSSSLMLQVFLPTPSARRATRSRQVSVACSAVFLPTPSARRATSPPVDCDYFHFDFYPRPPRGGRHRICQCFHKRRDFYPRPPRGGRHTVWKRDRRAVRISTHALREEGDGLQAWELYAIKPDFYPRPPRGGRPAMYPEYAWED